MDIVNSLFIKQPCPIRSEDSKSLLLYLSRCSFIHCFSEDENGIISWDSQESSAFLNNIVVEDCGSNGQYNFGNIKCKVVSVSMISSLNCRKGSHTLGMKLNSMVAESNFSDCQSEYETVIFLENQAEIRLTHINSCIANIYMILGFLSTLNRGSYIDITNCTSNPSNVGGVLRTDSDLFLYNSNFINNTGNLMFFCYGNNICINALNCYIEGINSCNGHFTTKSESGWIWRENDIGIVKAKGYEKESCREIKKSPISVLRLIATTITIKGG